MKLEVTKHEITDITIYDDEVVVYLEVSLSHGAIRKATAHITLEHTVKLAPLLPTGDELGIDDAIAMAVAGVKQRADLAVNALRGVKEL